MNARFFDVKKAKQDAVINAALKIFSECGYKKSSTDIIVKEAGISKGLLFHYFENKKGVYEFMYDYSVKYMTLELTRAVNKSEKDFFMVQVQVERAKTRVMKNYPYMQLFLNNAKFETDPEAVDAMGSNRGAMQDTYNSIYSQTDNTRFMDKIDINRIISMINWMSDGFIRDHLSMGDFNLDDMNEEFEKYLNMLRRHFYRAPGDDMISIAREEMVERDDSVMDQMKLNATFEERLMAGRTGSFGAEAVEPEETEAVNEEEKTEEVAEAGSEIEAEASADTETASEAETLEDTENSAKEADKDISLEETDEEIKTDDAASDAADKANGDVEDESDDKDDNTSEGIEGERNAAEESVEAATSAPTVTQDEIALPLWWTGSSNSETNSELNSALTSEPNSASTSESNSALASESNGGVNSDLNSTIDNISEQEAEGKIRIDEPIISEMPVPADILHTTLKDGTDEEDEEDEEDWSPRPVRQIRL